MLGTQSLNNHELPSHFRSPLPLPQLLENPALSPPSQLWARPTTGTYYKPCAQHRNPHSPILHLCRLPQMEEAGAVALMLLPRIDVNS